MGRETKKMEIKAILLKTEKSSISLSLALKSRRSSLNTILPKRHSRRVAHRGISAKKVFVLPDLKKVTLSQVICRTIPSKTDISRFGQIPEGCKFIGFVLVKAFGNRCTYTFGRKRMGQCRRSTWLFLKMAM